jgi:hypothetical protein
MATSALGEGDERLSASLEAAALRAIAHEHERLSYTHFGSRLRLPIFELGAGFSPLGCWVSSTRTLHLARSLLLSHGWGELVEVLKHEMAHQYVDEVLGVRDEAAHGPVFQRVCAERGIDGRAAGAPQRGTAKHPALERVAKLLALAESPNEHEAQAAMRAAQRLLLRHNIEAAAARNASGYGYRHIGQPTGRVRETARELASILTSYFFVDAIWVSVWQPREGKRGSVLEICGRDENLEIAEYVHAFLTHTADSLWRQHKRAQGITKDRDRQAYLAGVMAGFARRLADERTLQREAGLVYVGERELTQYMKRRHPRTTQIRRVSSTRTAAHAAGREAGRRIVLRKGVTAGPSSTARPRLPTPSPSR